jgi:hypothetical protein
VSVGLSGIGDEADEVWVPLDDGVLEVVGEASSRQTRKMARRDRERVTDIARRRWSVRAASAGELATARRPAAAGVSDRESGSGARRSNTRGKRRRKWSGPRRWRQSGRRRTRFGSAGGLGEARSASTSGDAAARGRCATASRSKAWSRCCAWRRGLGRERVVVGI